MKIIGKNCVSASAAIYWLVQAIEEMGIGAYLSATRLRLVMHLSINGYAPGGCKWGFGPPCCTKWCNMVRGCLGHLSTILHYTPLYQPLIPILAPPPRKPQTDIKPQAADSRQYHQATDADVQGMAFGDAP